MSILIRNILYFLTIFIPLTFTFNNSELFEFPKFILLLSGTLLIVVAWLIDHFYFNSIAQSPKTNNLLNPKTWPTTHYAVILILLTQTIATIFSINPYTSFWGYYSRFHQGLLTTICYSIIYFAAVIYLDKNSVQKIIKLSVNTSIIISLYAIAQRLGIDKTLWVQDVVNRPFSTLGQPNWLAAYLLPNLFLSLYLSHTKNSKNNYLLFTIYYVLILSALLLTKSRSGLLALVLSYPIYYFLLARQFTFSTIKASLIRHSLLVILLTLLVGTAYTPKLTELLKQRQDISYPTAAPNTGTQLENGGTESGDIRQIVWSGTLALIKQHPLFGTGPETFAYTYYWTRPLAHNYTSEWDYLYNKAHNEYLNLAATTGLLGLLAYLYLHYAVFLTSLTTVAKSKKINQADEHLLRHLYPVLAAVLISFSVTNFFGFSVIPVYLLFTLLAALPNAIPKQPIKPTHPIPYGLYLILLLSLLYPLNIYRADLAYAKGKSYLDAQEPASALPHLLSAVAKRPGLDLFHSALGEAYAQLSQTDQAIAQAELTRKLNPYHLNYHKSRTKIYLTLAASNTQSGYPQAAAELEDARAKAPTDPKLAYNLGLVYSRLGDMTKSEEQFKDAINLKNNYESPYFALTLLYEQTNQKELIPELLSNAKENLATYSSALKEKINQY